MKKILLIICIALSFQFILRAQCSDLSSVYPNYHLSFQDNFDYPVTVGSNGNDLNASTATATSGVNVIGTTFSYNWLTHGNNWNEPYDLKGNGGVNVNSITGATTSTYTEYLPENVTMVSPGIIRLTENYFTTPYDAYDYYTGNTDIVNHTSGIIHSKKKLAGYGIIEARLKLPHDEATVNAAEGSFWTSSGTEIDIIDLTSSHYMQQGIGAWDDHDASIPTVTNYELEITDITTTSPLPGCAVSGGWESLTDLSTDFHKYTCVWTPIDVSFFVDEKFTFDVPYTSVRTEAGLSYFMFYVIAKGLNPLSSCSPVTADGFFMDIDWVQIWEQNCVVGSINISTDATTITPYVVDPGLYKRSYINASSTNLVKTNELNATILEAPAITITSNFLADESVLYTAPAHHHAFPNLPSCTPEPSGVYGAAGTFHTNGFLEILPCDCRFDDTAWFKPARNQSINELPEHNIRSNSLNSSYNNDASNSVDALTSTANEKINSTISVFPNPTQNTITITYPCTTSGQLLISIKDVAGREVYNQSVGCADGGNVQQVVDMSGFAQGVYFVDLTLNEQHTVKKIVKM